MTPPRYKSGPKKGQFMPRSARKRRTKKVSKKRRASRKLGTAKRKGTTMPKRKRKSRRRRRGAGTTNLVTRMKVFGVTALYGYAKEQKNYLANVPKLDAIGLDGTVMLASHLLAKHGPSVTRKAFDLLATGLAGSQGLKFGQGGFQMASLQGYGGPSESISGTIDPNDFLAEDLPPEAA